MDKGSVSVIATDMYAVEDHLVMKALTQRLLDTLRHGLEINPVPVFFFRADDIGVPSNQFFRMMDLFVTFKIPLNLAVVPAWITRKRWEAMRQYHTRYRELFCWHQHGWRHMNHESTGKKQEFGSSRPWHIPASELEKGRVKLDSVLKDQFSLFFTPPWNRCSLETMISLSRMGFNGVSGSRKSLPPVPDGLSEFSVCVDLHTRKEKDFNTSWNKMFEEIYQGMISGLCGIMLHHMRMNTPAFMFLEYMLEQLSCHKQIQVMTFDQLQKSFS